MSSSFGQKEVFRLDGDGDGDGNGDGNGSKEGNVTKAERKFIWARLLCISNAIHCAARCECASVCVLLYVQSVVFVLPKSPLPGGDGAGEVLGLWRCVCTLGKPFSKRISNTPSMPKFQQGHWPGSWLINLVFFLPSHNYQFPFLNL